MAVVGVGGLGASEVLPEQLESLTDREKAWVMNHIGLMSPLNSTLENWPKTERIGAINSYFFENSAFKVRHIKNALKKEVLPIEQFDWIARQDERLCVWLHHELYRRKFNIPSVDSAPSSERRNLIIKAIDLEGGEDKKILLVELKREWASRLNDKKVKKWLDGDSGRDGRCEWAWDYLLRKWKAFSGLMPTSAKDYRLAVLATFDAWPFGGGNIFANVSNPDATWRSTSDGRQLFFEKMKRAWSQRKYRESLCGKMQYNIVMSDGIKAKLNALAKHYDSNINVALEELINKEVERISTLEPRLNNLIVSEMEEIQERRNLRQNPVDQDLRGENM